MKKLRGIAVCTIVWLMLSAFNIPGPTSDFYIGDFAGVLTSDVKEYICRNSEMLYSQTGAQIVVATVNSLEGRALEEYSLQMLNQWQIGSNKNNGVLVFIATKERKVRCEVGRGLEGRLNDAKVGRLVDEYAGAYFKDHDWNAGAKNLYSALLQEVYKEYGKTAPGDVIAAPQKKATNWPVFIIALAGQLILLFIIKRTGGGRRGGYYGGGYYGGGYYGGGYGSGGGYSGNSGGGGSGGGGGASRSY